MKLAAIDLGTNTFNLLVVEHTEGRFRELLRDRRFIFLSEEGIDHIGAASYERGMAAINAFAVHLVRLGVQRIVVKGTATLRRASNGPAFVAEVQRRTGLRIEVITGDEEARLIYLGVREAIPMPQPHLIVDVGGGSVEFIIADAHQIHWAQSFPVGVSVLFSAFHQQDPMPPEQLMALRAHLHTTLTPVREAMSDFSAVRTVVGASGTFDVLEVAMGCVPFGKFGSVVERGDFEALYQRVVGASLAQREAMADIPAHRKRLAVVGLVLIDYILTTFQIEEIKVSHFAMKEGMLQSLLADL